MTEFGGCDGGGGGGANGDGVGDVDASVPESIAEFPNLKLQGVRKRSVLPQLSQGLPEIDGGRRRRLNGGGNFELLHGGFDLEEKTLVRLRFTEDWPELRRGDFGDSHFFFGAK